MDTVTITDDEAFIFRKKALLISKRSLEFALNIAIKGVAEISQYYLDSEHLIDQVCEKEKLHNQIAKDYINLLWWSCHLQPDVANKLCFTDVIARQAAENVRKPLILLPYCDIAPAANIAISKVAKSVARISEWISRIA